MSSGTSESILRKKGPRMKIDGTLNLNTLIAAGSLLVSGALAYGALDKRISILEQVQMERTSRIEQELREVKNELKEVMKLLNGQRSPNG
jgi:hypothetical protein